MKMLQAGRTVSGSSPAPGVKKRDIRDRFVLPRPLRFAIRHLSRLVDTSVPVPTGIGTALALGFLALTIFFGVYSGGHGNAVLSSAASTAGLKVDAIRISGQIETTEGDVLSALDLNNHGALLGLDLQEARTRVLNLPWVEQVSLRKYFPDRLDVTLVEKKPFAVWQQDGQFRVIESDGKVISRIAGFSRPESRLAMLPRIIGKGAEKRAPELFTLVSSYPSIVSRVSSFVRVADRRWDIRLRNDIVVQLPELNESSALAVVVKMDRERQLLSRAINVVDMRLTDRMVLRMEPDAAEKRRISVEQRSKRMHKAEKSI